MDFINTGSAFLNFLIWFGLFIIIIEILTFIHELGHFIVAKLSGVRVAEFAIGFGPVMFQWGKKGTKYSIRWLPFGGYVSVLSQDVIDTINKVNETELTPQQMEQVLKKIKPFTLDEDFSGQTKIEQVVWWKKVVFALMGVTFNLIAMFMFVWIFAGAIGSPTSTQQMFIPVYVESNQTVDPNDDYVRIAYVDKVTVDYDGSGSKPTEIIEETSTDNFYSDVINAIYADNYETGTGPTDAGKIVFYGNYDADRNGSEETDYQITFVYQKFVDDQVYGTGDYWVVYEPETTNATYWSESLLSPTHFTTSDYSDYILYEEYTYQTSSNSFVEAFKDTGRAMLNSFLLMFTFGAVQIEELPSDHAYYMNTANMAEGWIWFLGMMIIFSALLIIFNILPIPPLDGWKATQWTYEGLSGKLIKPETEKALTKAGWGVILLWTVLLIFITPLFI